MWPFSTTYPVKSLTEVVEGTYDYIVVGGGTAGSALASRLSEDAHATVLLLERGPFANSLISRVPAASVANGSYTVRRKCAPAAGIDNREIDILTAETLGGNSRINGLIYTRGTPAYYNRWGRESPLWNWAHVEPFFKKVEETVRLRQTENLESGIYQHLEESAAALGLPVEQAGNRGDAPAMGYYHLDLTIDKYGYRHSAFHAYLPEKTVGRRKSLHICTDAIVSRLDVDSSEGIVRGVYVQSARTNTARTCHIRARREIILTAGAICNPQLLQLSGIGPPSLLEELDIPLTKALPGVGRHLGDHHLFPVFVEVPVHDTMQQLLTNPLQAAKHILLFAAKGQGWLKSTVDRSIYFNTSHIDMETGKLVADKTTLDPFKEENLPDVEIMVVPIGTKPDLYPNKGLFTLQVCLNQPKSEGTVHITCSDPTQDPEINLNMLTDPEDMEVARKALRFTLHLAEQFAFKSGYPSLARPFGGPGSRQWSEGDWLSVSDDELGEHIRKYIAPVSHLTSTCRMGLAEKGGVVDEHLKVHGFKNLRIADASILPFVTSSHPMAPIYMVAERCADFIYETWRL